MRPQDRIPPLEIDGNRLTLLVDGPERLEGLIRLIDEARNELRILYYIWKADAAGHRVREALMRAVERGVKVSLLVDSFGSTGPGFFKPLVEAQCRFCRFVPRWGRRYLLRNHQKLAIADGRSALIGGFNISDDYFGTIEEGSWRDLGLRVDGPTVASLDNYFDALFGWAETENATIRRLRRMLSRHSMTDGRLHWLFGGPTRRLSPWARSVRNDMRRARMLDIIAAYFAPSRSMLRRIYGVARRGRVRLIAPAKSDWYVAMGSARHFYSRLLRRGVEVYEYQPTRLHTKLIVIDDVIHIGSANFDLRSLYLNLEMMLRVEDSGFAETMRRFVDREVADSQRITPEVHRAQRTWWNRLRWAMSYFVMATADYNLARRLNFGRSRRSA